MLFTASISVCAETLNILVDKIVAAQFLGEKALAAITFFTPLFSIVLFVSAVVMVGTLVCYSFEIGKMQKDRANQFFGQGIILSFASGIILAGLFTIIRSLLLRGLALDADLIGYIDGFYTWFIWFSFLIPVNNVLQEMVYIDGDTRTCNLSYAALLVGNAIFSIVFCQSMGIKGVALGTLVSVLLSIAILCTHFIKKSNTLKFVWYIKWRDMAAVVRFSLAEASEFLMFALFSSILNYYFICSFGFGKLPVLSMVYEIVELSVFFNGIWMAAEPLVNTYRGEKNCKGIMRSMQFVNRTTMKEALLASLLLFIAAPFIISVFHIHSEGLQDIAIFAVRACAVGFLPLAFCKIYANYHVHENPLISLTFIALAMFIAPFLSVMTLGSFFGPKAFWVGFAIAPFIAFALGCALQIALYGREKFPLMIEDPKDMANWFITDTRLTPESLLKFRDRMGRIMENKNVNANTHMKVMLLIEELGMAIEQRNEAKTVFIEFALVFRPDHLMLICKDDGKRIDMTDLEQSITDLRMYLINMFMAAQQAKQYLPTANYNRYAFKFER